MSNVEHFLDLPDEVLLNVVFPRLSYLEISKLCRVHPKFNSICGIDQLWKGKVQLDYPENYNYKPEYLTWREFYRLLVDSRLIPFYLNGKVNGQVCFNPENWDITIQRFLQGFQQEGGGQLVFVNKGTTPISSVPFPGDNVIIYEPADGVTPDVEKVVIMYGLFGDIDEDIIFRSLTNDGQILYGIIILDRLYLGARRFDELGTVCNHLPLYTLINVLERLNIVTFREANIDEKVIELLNSHLLDGINTGKERRRLIDLFILDPRQLTGKKLNERHKFLNSVRDALCPIIWKVLESEGRILYN